MDRLLAFVGRASGFQVWLLFSAPVVIVAGVASLWLGEAALWAAFFVVPAVGYAIFYLVPFIAAVRSGDKAALLKSGFMAVAVPAVIVIGWVAAHHSG